MWIIVTLSIDGKLVSLILKQRNSSFFLMIKIGIDKVALIRPLFMLHNGVVHSPTSGIVFSTLTCDT